MTAETLVIGLGGVGCQVVRRLQERLSALSSPLAALPARAGGTETRLPELLAVDTDRSVLHGLNDRGLLLSTSAAVLDAAYRQPDRFHAEWMQREVLRSRPFVEQGVAGARMLGRFLLLLPENRSRVEAPIRQWLQWGKGTPARRRVYVVAGAGGGTGSAQLVDVAYLVQSVAAAAGCEVDLRAVVLVPSLAERAAVPNAFATLTELHYFSDPYTRYAAHLSDGDAPFETRRAPFNRISLLTSVTAEGEVIPLVEQQERASVYLMTASVGDEGSWEAERSQREATVSLVDPEGNPQVFTTFGAEWVEYPEERLVSAVYRNLIRRSMTPWLQGDQAIHLRELPSDIPLKDSEALSALITDVGDDEAVTEKYLRPVNTRLPWIHKAPPSQWVVMDQELQAAIDETVGTRPGTGRPGKGPMADRFKSIREQVIAGLRGQAATWLKREGVSLERVSRTLGEAATELRTATDPGAQWEEASRLSGEARRRLLATVVNVRRDPFLLFWKRQAAHRLALEYQRVASIHVHHYLRAQSLPYMAELRAQVLEPVRAWTARIAELSGLMAQLSRSMADYESSLLERLRADEEDKRLVLGLLQLPGAETPYVANTGWRLPYCRPEDERAVIQELRRGWIERLVDAPDGLLADPRKSLVDGPSDHAREDRLPWLMPANYTPAPEAQEGPQRRMRDGLMQVDRELRLRVEDRLRAWLSATAFQRMAEVYRDPLQLEAEVQRLVSGAAQLPALEPPHVRPEGFPPEYELIFFAEAKAGEVPKALRLVVEASERDHPTRIVPSKSTHFLTAIAEHQGFSLSRCPTYYHLEEGYREWLASPAGAGLGPFNRIDVPWASATLVSRTALRDASDVLYLALAWGILRANPDGSVPVPGSLVPNEPGERRFPLPGELDLAIRQLAGDLHLLDGVGKAVDRTFQAKGVEWCGLQLERVVKGEASLGVRFPGRDAPEQQRIARLTALRAAARYEDLFAEYARTPTARETEWLRAGNNYYCPACAQDLGSDPAAIPGACPRCRQPLLPHLVTDLGPADGFRRIPNPFVVGTPLETGSNVFMGREDIIAQVHDRLIRPAQRTILILIGERRCGKTSALKQLQYRLSGDLTPLFVDMQGLTATDLPGFLWWLAWRMKEALDERGIQIELPSYEDFTSGPADYQFETVVLQEVRRKLSGGRVLLMLDEFEVLAQRVMNGTFDARAFDYIRHLMQHGEGIEFLFAGTHVLRQFAANYVTFLFNIGVFLNVDFLRPADALRLIQEPVAHAGVTFSEEALESVLEQAGAHAYFTQMFGFHLVERLNRLRKRNVTREDVEAESAPVIAAAGAHLDHLWGQLTAPDRLLISFFVDFCGRGQRCREEELLAAAVRDDPTLRPFVFRSSVEKLIAVGLLRASTEVTAEGREARMLGLTAEVYRQWLLASHPYRRLRDEGLTWA